MIISQHKFLDERTIVPITDIVRKKKLILITSSANKNYSQTWNKQVNHLNIAGL